MYREDKLDSLENVKVNFIRYISLQAKSDFHNYLSWVSWEVIYFHISSMLENRDDKFVRLSLFMFVYASRS